MLPNMRALSARCSALRKWGRKHPPHASFAGGASCAVLGLFDGGASRTAWLEGSEEASCAFAGERVGGSASCTATKPRTWDGDAS
jgi:hypothetical protein